MNWETHTPNPGPPDPKRHFAHTVAKFDSDCCGCGFDLEEGLDLVFKVDGEWQCEECAIDAAIDAVADGGAP